jgi:uncharacterized protein YciI
VELEKTTLVFLRRPADAPPFSDDELDALQAAHLAYLAAMKEAGHLLVAGPFADSPDESWRGICLYRTGLAETRALAESDPMVRAGRLEVDVFTWLTQRGELRF